MSTPDSPRLDPALKAAIDRHFAGRGDPDSFRRIEQALAEDARAKAYFDRRALLAELDPSAAGAKERLGAALGLDAGPAPKRTLSWLPALGLASAAAAALLVVVLPASRGLEGAGVGAPDDGFRARGNGRVDAGLSPRVWAYRIERGTEPVELEAGDKAPPLRADQELAFAYANPEGRSHLMVWGVDEKGGVYWYHPAWTDPAKDPAAVAIEKGAEVHELPEAIAHDVGGKRLSLYALFTDRRPTVREVEAALAKGEAPPGELQELLTLDVDRPSERVDEPDPKGAP